MTTVNDYFADMGLATGDELAHYGKKGMKWGVTNESSGGGSPRKAAREERKAARAARNTEIGEARLRQQERANKLENQAIKTYMANGEKEVLKANQKYERMALDLVLHPDAATAQKMTSGEKAATAVSLVGTAALIAGYGALALSTRR